MAPDISIVIPTRGDNFLLRATLDTLNSALPLDGGFEVIVVRDGPGPVLSLADEEDFAYPVRLMTTEERSGPAHARNFGAGRAVGDVLVFLDDDVIVPDDWATGLRRALSEHPEAALIGGPIRAKESANLISQMFESFIIRHHTANGRVHLASACLTVRRDAFERLGGFAECFPNASGEDWDLSHRAHEQGLEVVVSPSLLVYHWNPRRLSQIRSRASRYASSAGIISERLARGSTGGPPRASGGSGAATHGVAAPIAIIYSAIIWVRRYRLARELHGRLRSAVLLLLHLPWFVTYGLAVRRQVRDA